MAAASPSVDTLADRVDTIVEQTDTADEGSVRRAVAEIRAIYAAVPWMPQAFQAVLAGKNSLPARKLRPGLFRRDAGFLGTGEFRDHFFGTRSMGEVSAFFLRDVARYSTPAIRLQKRLSYARKARA